MKRTSFLLASLTAIALLSCSSFDGSNSSAEDVNYPKNPPLQKVSPIDGGQILVLVPPSDEAQGIDPGQSTINASGSKTVSCGSMSISGTSGCSSVATCDFTSVPAGSLNTSYQFIGGGPSGSSFGIDYANIQCGSYLLSPFYPFSYANMSVTEFYNKPANVKCYIQFCGDCYGTGCKLSITNIQGYQVYH